MFQPPARSGEEVGGRETNRCQQSDAMQHQECTWVPWDLSQKGTRRSRRARPSSWRPLPVPATQVRTERTSGWPPCCPGSVALCCAPAREGPGLGNRPIRSLCQRPGLLNKHQGTRFQQSQTMLCTKDIKRWLLALQKRQTREDSFKSQHPRCIGNEIQFRKNKFNSYITFEDALLAKKKPSGDQTPVVI